MSFLRPCFSWHLCILWHPGPLSLITLLPHVLSWPCLSDPLFSTVLPLSLLRCRHTSHAFFFSLIITYIHTSVIMFPLYECRVPTIWFVYPIFMAQEFRCCVSAIYSYTYIKCKYIKEVCNIWKHKVCQNNSSRKFASIHEILYVFQILVERKIILWNK